MKIMIFSILLLLSGCTTCYIPLVEYESHGGSEYLTTLDLKSEEYALSLEQWKPGSYEYRTKQDKKGLWSCKGSTAEIVTKNGVSKAEYKEIGKNPLGLPETTKALVFMSSDERALSNEVLYPNSDQN